MATIYEQLITALETTEANIVGQRYVKMEIDGDTYSAISSIAASRHNGANRWGRVDFKKNGKKIAKANLM